jgi:hypothetical protein
MRKSLWIILTVLLVAMGVPNARADTFNYAVDFTVTAGNFANQPAIGTIQYDTLTGVISPFTVTWDSTQFPFPAITDTTLLSDSITWQATAITGVFVFTDNNLGATDSMTTLPGSYSSANDMASGNVTLVQTPEPATGAFMLLGMGFVLVVGKRIA